MAAWMLSLSEDEALVRTALKKMPVAEVPELLNELQRGLYRSGDHLPKYLRCLAILLEVKFTYLSMTNLGQYQALKQLLDARTTLLAGCLRLKGRLDLLLAHTTKPDLKYTRPAAKQTYESDSEEESEEDEEEDEERENDHLKMNGHDHDDDVDQGILDDEDMDEEMFGSEEEEGDEEEEEEDIEEGEDAAAEADEDSAAEADDDDDDDDLEMDDDDDD